MLKSYFELKQFVFQTDAILGNNTNYKKIKTQICLYSLGKFNTASARTFYTNDYFTDITGTSEIELSFAVLNAEIINQINDDFLQYMGVKNAELNKFKIVNDKEPHLIKISHNNEYYYRLHGNCIDRVNKINNENLDIERLDIEGIDQFNVDLKKISNIELFILVWNLLTYFGYLSLKKYSYTQENKFFFDTNGYLVISNFIDALELQKLKETTYQLANLAKERKEAYLYGEGSKAQRIYNLIAKAKIYRDFLLHERINEILEIEFHRNTLHSKYYLSSFQANILYPGAKSQVLHSDLAVPEPLPTWVLRININLLLDDFTEENGATIVIPGSHKYLHKPEPDLVSNKMKKLIAPAGSLVMWTGHLWHKSGENASTNPRAALLACFAASHLREIAVEENYLLINHDKFANFEPKILELIGVNHGIKKGNF